MSDIETDTPPSRQPNSKSEMKLATTDRAARQIIDAEAERREVKTAKLRQARLEREAQEAAAKPPAPEKPKARRTGRKTPTT